MKKIEAIIRTEKLEDIKAALDSGDLAKGLTVSQVLGHGTQKGFAEYVRGQEILTTLLAKVKLEIITTDERAEKVASLIESTAKTGEVGDGKIFIYPVDEVIRIRTGERGEDAI